MKFIKENWFVFVSIIICVIVYMFFDVRHIEDSNTINKIESEKVELKKNAEIEIKNLNKIIETQKGIATSKDFEIVKRDKIIQDKENALKIKQKAKIRYKTKIIYKTSPVSDLWDFSETVTFDFWKYVKEAEKKDIVTKKIILDLKLINAKSEQQIKIIKNMANGWNWTYGFGGSVGTRGADISLNVSYSKRIRKIK